MKNKNTIRTHNFNNANARAILSILLFIFTYISLVGLSIILTILCGFFAYYIIELQPHFAIILFAIGIVSMGILVFIFLIKFIFKTYKTDRSNLIEISKKENPELFIFIKGIVKEVKTKFPKKIYVTSDVNASVFYDSSFWSMFFPIRKNLQIGIGLVNSVSIEEFKAILAHEFGHFSQRSMKVGSYVYNVNQIIYNLLYDNESYDKMSEGWANIHSFFAVFSALGYKIIHDIQWLLKKVYKVVHKNYMGLSREMEFNADMIAAQIAGPQPLINSILRFGLANHSLNLVFEHYNSKISDNLKAQNIYPLHKFVMNFIAGQSNINVLEGLPQVTDEFLNRYNKSKLVIKNQWASHPSKEDRICELKKLTIVNNNKDKRNTRDLFGNIALIETALTEKLFSEIKYPSTPTVDTYENFTKEFSQKNEAVPFSHLFNNYYEYKNPPPFNHDKIEEIDFNIQINADSLFSNKSLDLIYSAYSLEDDIKTLQQISKDGLAIKSFDYDGTKYFLKDCNDLIFRLEAELKSIKEQIEVNDKNIFIWFHSLARQQGKINDFIKMNAWFTDFDKEYHEKIEIYNQLLMETAFLQQTTTYEKIESNFIKITATEKLLKDAIQLFFRTEPYAKNITEESSKIFNTYLSKDWIYFDRPVYDEKALQVLFDAANSYQFVLAKTYISVKKVLLDFMASLAQN